MIGRRNHKILCFVLFVFVLSCSSCLHLSSEEDEEIIYDESFYNHSVVGYHRMKMDKHYKVIKKKETDPRDWQTNLLNKIFDIGDKSNQDWVMPFLYSLFFPEEDVDSMRLSKRISPESGKYKYDDANNWRTELVKPNLKCFDKNAEYFWLLKTNVGIIKIKLMHDIAPMHVTSTIFLTEKGFYDDLIFHRLIKGFMVQGGCPIGTGEGGPGYSYDGEFDENITHDRPYLLCMANAGPGTDGSQFYISFAAIPWQDGKDTIFGEVVDGKEVVDAIETVETGACDRPVDEIKIVKATIEKVMK